jgi:hypothetical protein
MLGGGSATLLAAAAPWQPGRGASTWAPCASAAGCAVQQFAGQAGRLINGLLDGRSPVVRNYGR